MRTMLLVAAGWPCWGSPPVHHAGNRQDGNGEDRDGQGRARRAETTSQYVDTPTGRWLVHDVNRPAPPVITPDRVRSAPPTRSRSSTAEPSMTSNWTTQGATHQVGLPDGLPGVGRKAGPIQTKPSSALPVARRVRDPIHGKGRARPGNSGVFSRASTRSRSSIPIRTRRIGRPVRRPLPAVRSAGQRQPEARRMAELRYPLHRRSSTRTAR